MTPDEPWHRWSLTPDGPVIRTPSSDVWPVRFQGRPATLKLSRTEEETRGHALMVWLEGDGAARVYGHAEHALLMERLNATPSLTGLVAAGDDDGATTVLVRAAQGVHRDRQAPWPDLPGLREWFRALEGSAALGEDFAAAWDTARALLEDPRGERPLHGDLHHGNVMWSARGWVVIDPKGLIGDPGFDHANMLCNPSLEAALRPGRLERQVAVVARAGGPEPARLLAWVQAYAGLSAAWHREGGDNALAARTLEVARRAAGLLSGRQT